MRPRHPLAIVVSAACLVMVALAGPATAVPLAHAALLGNAVRLGDTAALGDAVTLGQAAAASTPMCVIASPENIVGAQFVDNQTVNGTWTYSTGVACSTGNLADIALYEELDFNGTKVNSQLKNFTGVPRNLDAITLSFHCAVCTGTWKFLWGQVMKAPTGFLFVTPPSGCILVNNGAYELCVQTKTVTL